jgi:glycosyltransferase involved in cell wall biosynthesis
MNSKVVFASTSFVNQVSNSGFVRGSFVRDYAEAISDHGNSVWIVTHSSTVQNIYQSKANLKTFKISKNYEKKISNGFPEHKLDGIFIIQTAWYFTKMFWKLLNTCWRIKPRYILSHWLVPTGFIAEIVGYILQIPVIHIVYGAELVPFEKDSDSLKNRFIGRFFNKNNKLVSISEFTQNRLRNCLFLNSTVIPDGIDTSRYFFKSKEIGSKIVIGFTGRMVERKGHIVILEAAKELQKSNLMNYSFLIGGEGPKKEELLKYVKKNKIMNVEFIGFVPQNEMVSFLQKLDLYILPSIKDSKGDVEGSATAALEAMSCGTPALVSYHGGNIGSIENGSGAWYFEEGNSLDLSKKISEFQAIRESQDYSKQARNYVLKNYDWNSISLRISSILTTESTDS